MSKDSHFTGQPVYNQVLKLLDREKIMQISRETTGSEAYVKRFDGYQHLVVMLYGVLKHFDSLRELEVGMKAEAHKLHHLGMDYLVRRSTLAEANIRRPQEFFARVYAHLLEKYARFLADSNNLEVLAQCERSVARHCRGATHRLSVAALPFAGNNTQECQGQFVEFPLIRAFLEQPLFETVQDALSRASKTCQYMGFIA